MKALHALLVFLQLSVRVYSAPNSSTLLEPPTPPNATAVETIPDHHAEGPP